MYNEITPQETKAMITEILAGKLLRRTFHLKLENGDEVVATDEREGIAPRNRSVSGYGGKIPTGVEIKHAGRWRRVYVMIYSNSGTTYVRIGGKKIIVNDFWVNA